MVHNIIKTFFTPFVFIFALQTSLQRRQYLQSSVSCYRLSVTKIEHDQCKLVITVNKCVDCVSVKKK